MLAQHLRPWLMTEVFVVGGCVAYTRIEAVAKVSVDAGGWCLAGSAMLMSHGMEHWHPDPEFFYKPGGGPILDIGPY